MTITEFCKGRGIDSQAVRKYIERHPEHFTGHTGKTGREITLDDHAIDILEDKYPFPRPVEIIKDTETMEKLLKAQETIIQLQARLVRAETAKVLLEDRERQLQRAYDECDKLQHDLDLEKSKTRWEKLRGR